MKKKEDQNNLLRQRDPDLANAEIALRRAAIKAREIARKTGTAVVYSVNGKIVKEKPSEEAVQKTNKLQH